MGKQIDILISNKNWRKLIKKLRNRKKRDKYRTALSTVVPNEDPKVKRYPIHIACMSGITKHAMRAILDVCPEAASMVDNEGSTPLHYALHYDDRSKIDVLKILLDAYPEALSIQDKYGCTPMFHAVERKVGVEMEKMALLLSHNAAIEALTVTCQSMAARKGRRMSKDSIIDNQEHYGLPNLRNSECMDAYDTSPIYKIWDVALLRCSTMRFTIPIRPSREDLSRRERKKAGKRLEKAVVMLEALYLKQPLDSTLDETAQIQPLPQLQTQVRELTPIHSSEGNQSQSERLRSNVKNKLNKVLFLKKNQQKQEMLSDEGIEIILEEALRRQLRKIGKYEPYIRLFDLELGATKFRVLHAVLTYHAYLPDVAYDYAMVHYNSQVIEKEEKTGNLPLHIACRMHDNSAFNRDDVLLELLSLYASAAKVKNRLGQLPLHIALSVEDQWSFKPINELLKANPSSHEEVDTVSKLYPFQLAAVGKKEAACDQLSSIYALLRKSPVLAK